MINDKDYTLDPYHHDFEFIEHFGRSPLAMVCKTCDGREFIVGQVGPITAVKCPKCEWEVQIND